MTLPPLDERSVGVLRAEKKRLEEAYKKCAEILGPIVSPSGARALDRINDAVDAIEKELQTRSQVGGA
jgi:hypothetical protein